MPRDPPVTTATLPATANRASMAARPGRAPVLAPVLVLSMCLPYPLAGACGKREPADAGHPGTQADIRA